MKDGFHGDHETHLFYKLFIDRVKKSAFVILNGQFFQICIMVIY